MPPLRRGTARGPVGLLSRLLPCLCSPVVLEEVPAAAAPSPLPETPRPGAVTQLEGNRCRRPLPRNLSARIDAAASLGSRSSLESGNGTSSSGGGGSSLAHTVSSRGSLESTRQGRKQAPELHCRRVLTPP